jgi:hypothetical protein
MRLKLERMSCGPVCSIGTLSVNGNYECFTLEDVRRETDEPVEKWKIPGKTAIPEGVYNVVVTPSQRFKRDLPLLENVPGFSGVRIHSGNTAEDTEGCILVGTVKAHDSVLNSRLAFEQLYKKITEAISSGETVTLEIT